MKEQDFILLIMNCKKYENKADYQRQTWLPLISPCIKFFHVIGDETLDVEYNFDEDKRILTVKTADDYVSLPKKVISAYQAINETFRFKYLFKTDDDQTLTNPKFLDVLINIVTTKETKIHYGGHIINLKQPYLSQYNRIHPELPKNIPLYVTKYCSGRFYFLSNEAIQDLILKRKDVEKEYLEDYAIGYNLNPFYKIDILSLKTDKYFMDMDDNL
jgi:hypothetical protein